MAPPLPIQEAVTSAQLAELYRVQGKLGLSLDEVVVPVVLVGNLLAASPNADPVASGPRDCAGGIKLSANGFSVNVIVGLDNPVGSGVVAVITKTELALDVRTPSPNLFEAQLAIPVVPLALGAAPHSAGFTDGRVTGVPACRPFGDEYPTPVPPMAKEFGFQPQLQQTDPTLVDIRRDESTYIIKGGQQLVFIMAPALTLGTAIELLPRWWWTEYQDAG